MKYSFNPKGHKHFLDGKAATGITTVLGVIAKPALISWSARVACEFVEEWVKSHPEPKDTKLFVSAEELFKVLLEARKAHTRKKEEAGAKGTDVHALIEEIIKTAIANTQGLIVWNTPHENKQVQNFIDWAIQNKVKFLESEKSVWSESLFVAGICDFTCEIDGKKFVGDLKTGSKIYPEAFYQTAAYRLLLEEMGEQGYTGSVIVNIKKDGSFNADSDVAFRYDYETDKNAFLAALTIYRASATFK